MREVSLRDFRANMKKELVECPFAVTVHGAIKFYVSKDIVMGKVIKTKEEAKEVVSKLGSNLGGYNEYGCGCVKDGGNLCPKHGSV